jgi:hypothetical protein
MLESVIENLKLYILRFETRDVRICNKRDENMKVIRFLIPAPQRPLYRLL